MEIQFNRLFFVKWLSLFTLSLIVLFSCVTNLVFADDTTRPNVTEVGIFVGNEYKPGEDFRNVPIDASIYLKVKDDSVLSLSGNNYIIVKDDMEPPNIVQGIVTYVNNNTNEVTLQFKPTTDGTNETNWVEGKTYTVTLSDTLTDGTNKVFPIDFKFTTVKTTLVNDNNNPNVSLRNGNPHVSFEGKPNICFNCHGTQKNLALAGGKTVEDAATEFCLTCHDGTVAPSVTEIKDISDSKKLFVHGKSEAQVSMSTGQCSDCHDSHLVWSEANPNSLKTKMVYGHKKGIDDILFPNVSPDTPVSNQDNCFSCHKDETGKVKELASTDTINGASNPYYQADGLFQPYNYKKMATTTGNAEDMSLCLSCHDGSNPKVSNIAKYYNAIPSSDNKSGHKILFGDRGSEGYLICSDCHETHGSNNIYLLKKELGHENVNGTYTSGATKPSEWTATEERAFCLKCHNGATLTYGIVGQLKKVDAKSVNIEGHQDTDTNISCSSCHGPAGISDFIGAAHAPLKKIPAAP